MSKLPLARSIWTFLVGTAWISTLALGKFSSTCDWIIFYIISKIILEKGLSSSYKAQEEV